MRWDLAHSWQERTDERQTSDLRRAPRGNRLRVVRARRVADEEVRSPASDLVGEREQRVEDVLGAAQRFRSNCPAHPRQVRIDPPQPRNAVENLLEASFCLAVVDPRDAMTIFTFPVVLGGGSAKALFAGGSAPRAYKLTRARISSTGVVIGHDERDGAIKIGETALNSPSEA